MSINRKTGIKLVVFLAGLSMMMLSGVSSAKTCPNGGTITFKVGKAYNTDYSDLQIQIAWLPHHLGSPGGSHTFDQICDGQEFSGQVLQDPEVLPNSVICNSGAKFTFTKSSDNKKVITLNCNGSELIWVE